MGKGTFGTVELCTFRGYSVAVKKFRENYTSKEDVIREATMMSKLSHQNLPYLFGICTESTPFYLVSWFCGIDGQSFTVCDALGRETSHSLPWFQLMEESSIALQYMHDSGYLHNDVKSDNLLLTKQPSTSSSDDNVHVVLNDLGKATNIKKGQLYKLTPEEMQKYHKVHS